MPVELSDLVGAGRAAVLTMEIQRGVVGDLSSFPALADEVEDFQLRKQSLPLSGWKRRQQVILLRILDAIWHAGWRGPRRRELRRSTV